MTKPELNEYRITLQNKRVELAHGNRSREDLTVEAAADEMDQTQGGQERDLAVGTLNRDGILLRDVRAALARIEQGTFGICVDCQYDISRKRLAAVPWAASCIVCQEAADNATDESFSAVGASLESAA